MQIDIRPVESQDGPALRVFLDRIPEGDRTFFKQDVADPGLVEAWLRPGGARRAVATEGGAVIGFTAVIPLHGWSAHVGELLLIVDPDRRGRGVGQALARQAVIQALDLGLAKVVVEVVADQESRIAMFRSLGFDPEALLRGHIRDRHGNAHDLIVLGHHVADTWSVMATAGIPEAL